MIVKDMLFIRPAAFDNVGARSSVLGATPAAAVFAGSLVGSAHVALFGQVAVIPFVPL